MYHFILFCLHAHYSGMNQYEIMASANMDDFTAC